MCLEDQLGRRTQIGRAILENKQEQTNGDKMGTVDAGNTAKGRGQQTYARAAA